jgi:hypothetical protein
MTSDADIAALVARFEDCTQPVAQFRHRQHLQVAWWLLRGESLLSAMPRFIDGLRRYAASIGQAQIYHETMTWAYLLLVHDRLERAGRQRSWDEFERDHPELFTRELVHAYWKPETLASPLARRTFIFPDAPAAASSPSAANRTDDRR